MLNPDHARDQGPCHDLRLGRDASPYQSGPSADQVGRSVPLSRKNRDRTRDSASRLPHPASRAGFSLIELLVVTLIVTLLAIGIGMAVARALTVEQNYREEAGVRSALAHHLAYAERYLSLAVNFDDADYRATYPSEVGGISWETGHWIRVTSADMLLTNRQFGFLVSSGDERKEPEQEQLFSPDGFLYRATANVTNAYVEGTGSLRRLVIQAEYQVRPPEGGVTNLSIEVSRPIRLWNQ